MASTKAFTAQLCALAATVIAGGRAKGVVRPRGKKSHLTGALSEVPRLITEALKLDSGYFENRLQSLQGSRRSISGTRGALSSGFRRSAKAERNQLYTRGRLCIGRVKARAHCADPMRRRRLSLSRRMIRFSTNHFPIFRKLPRATARSYSSRTRPAIEAAADAPMGHILMPDCDDFIAPILYAPAQSRCWLITQRLRKALTSINLVISPSLLQLNDIDEIRSIRLDFPTLSPV